MGVAIATTIIIVELKPAAIIARSCHFLGLDGPTTSTLSVVVP